MYQLVTRRGWLAGAALATQRMALSAPEQLRLPRKVRLALIGLEGHTGEVLSPLNRVPDVELVAVSDPDSRAMARLTRARPALRQYTDYRQLLEREQLDMAAICGSNAERAATVLACVQRKLHIVAEKPLTLDRAGLERIKAAVKSAGVRLSMLLPMRFSPPYLALKQIVDAGEIGEVAQISAQKSYKLGQRAPWMLRRSLFGGTIPYIGIHMVDLMRWSSGREMVEAASFQAHIGFPDYGEMENTTATIFRMDNGGAATLHMDYLRPETAPSHGDDRLRLAGTKGVAEYQAATGVTLVTGAQKPRVIAELPAGRSLFLDFLDSVYNGKPCGLEMSDIYRVNEIVLAAREAAESHRLVKT